MKFEHLIAINDPANPLLEPLARSELWRGLVRRVDDPLPFLPGLRACALLERRPDYARRELDFGAVRIVDQVRLVAETSVEFVIEPTPEHAGGSLCIQIEEPAAGALFLRFTYRTEAGPQAAPDDAAYADYVKAAYRQSDIDCVSTIRQLIAEGMLH